MSKKERINYIDIARGMALFFVVLGHLVKGGSKSFNWIFSFHMPAFFIISGMCFDSGKYKNFWNFIKRKFKSMVIPYIGFCIFGFIISYIIPAWRATLFQEYTWKAIFWYTQPETLHVGQVWFLIALFNSSIFFYFIHKYIFSIKK